MLRCSLAINTGFGHRGIRNTLKWVYWCSVAKVALGCDLPKVVQVFDVEQFSACFEVCSYKSRIS